MTNTMMAPTTMGMPALGMPGSMSTGMGMPSAPTMGAMVPRCTVTFEKCTGGMKIVCSCPDKMACSMLQNLCATLAGTMCSCCCMMNGMAVCCCNLTMGMCKCEMTSDGCTIMCTSGDKACCDMIQACCECMNTMMKAGCTCYVMMNNMPVCCCC